MLSQIGLDKELERSSQKHIRAGKGKMRGRRTKQPIGPLIVTAGECDLSRSGINIPGLDVVPVTSLNAELLAPGGLPGRLTIFTQAAVEKLKQDNLYN